MKIEGGCLCGQVHYAAEAEPVFVGLCHCSHCQKSTGSAFRVAVAIPTAALSVQGTLKTFDDRGDSGKILHRRFCPDCGSSIVNEGDAMPGVSIVGAGTLDDSRWVEPTLEIYCDSAQSWVRLDGERARLPGSPPGVS
jgi:hypothetical protein